MKQILTKLVSRKLWLAIAGVCTGIALALGTDGGEITSVTGAVTALVSAVTYIIVEGKVDAQRIKVAIEQIQNAAEVLDDDRS